MCTMRDRRAGYRLMCRNLPKTLYKCSNIAHSLASVKSTLSAYFSAFSQTPHRRLILTYAPQRRCARGRRSRHETPRLTPRRLAPEGRRAGGAAGRAGAAKGAAAGASAPRAGRRRARPPRPRMRAFGASHRWGARGAETDQRRHDGGARALKRAPGAALPLSTRLSVPISTPWQPVTHCRIWFSDR